MYVNIRGYKSKFESLLEKIEEIEPTIFSITETHLMEAQYIKKIKGYVLYRNDRDNYGGGIIIGVKEELQNICTVVEKSNEVGETLWIVIDNNKVKLRIGTVYAPQETRTSKDTLKVMYGKIKSQILMGKERQQSLLLMGDFNCKIGEEIKGNKPDVTMGGRMLLKMEKQNNLTILNRSEKCKGLWTRVQGDSRSVLDYILINAENEGVFTEMLIDEDQEFAPASYENNEISYSTIM